MNSSRVPHNRLSFGLEEVRAVTEVVESGYWAQGPQVAALEAELADTFSVDCAVAVASGSAALELALMGLGIGAGKRVCVPAYACVALPNAVLRLGAEPVPVDVDPHTLNALPNDATKNDASVVVNTFGCPADVDAWRTRGTPVVEDLAHGAMMTASGPVVRGDAAILSMYATKLLGGGEGGAVLTNNADLANWVREWRDYVDLAPDARRQNARLSDLHAALARVQLGRLDTFVARRQEIAETYTHALRPLAPEHLQLPCDCPGRVWYRYTVQLTHASALSLCERLDRAGVGAARPVEPWLDDLSVLPASAAAFETALSIPAYPDLTDEEQQIVIAALTEELTCQ